MLDYDSARQHMLDYWKQQPTDNPFLVNGFRGTWKISDHALIPNSLSNFLLEYFWQELPETRKSHITTISLQKINDCLNSVWEGPGSMEKIVNLTYELRVNRLSSNTVDVAKVMKGVDTPTIDSDLDEEDEEELEDL